MLSELKDDRTKQIMVLISKVINELIEDTTKKLSEIKLYKT